VAAPRADVVLAGSVGPEPAAVGDTLSYDLVLTNKGPARASATTLTLQLPPELSPGAASVSQGSCSTSAQTLSCALGVLEAGAPAGGGGRPPPGPAGRPPPRAPAVTR